MKKQTGRSAPMQWIKHDVTCNALAASQRVFSIADIRDFVFTEVNPEDFHTVETFRRSYWMAEMWSKYPHPLDGVDTEAVARQSFEDAERVCAASNERLTDVFLKPGVPESIRSVLLRARRILTDLLGDITVDDIANAARWGPGSTTSLPRKFATPATKWQFCHHVTLDAVPYVDAFSAWTGWVFRDPVVVPGNKVVFVAKNAKTKRTIAIEPDWNCFFQLGLGSAIRQRLNRVGLLRDNAQEIHQQLAKRGSVDGFLATVDLRGASDTISMALCEALLPEGVLNHVRALRSPYGTFDEKTWFPYEKVSSMGNGYTFELETALFWALSKAVAGHASVYGDDIVVPSACVGWLAEVFSFCGLTFNEKKSHYGDRNHFRESCGGHFFKGVDVTPVYVRKSLVGVHRLATANELRKAMTEQILPWLEPVWKAMAVGVPRLFYGPPSVDGVLHVESGLGRPEWVPKLQSYRGLRLVKRFRHQTPLQLGSYRHWLFGARTVQRKGLWQVLFGDPVSRYKWEKDPGVPVTSVTEWISDEAWSCDRAVTPSRK